MAYGALTSLLPLLVSSQPHLLQRRALYALGALLRGQPTAANNFIVSNQGLEILSEGVVERSGTVLAKITTLLTDLLTMEVILYIMHAYHFISLQEPLLLTQRYNV